MTHSDPQLLHRLRRRAGRPGLSDRTWAERILTRHQRMVAGLPLSDLVAQHTAAAPPALLSDLPVVQAGARSFVDWVAAGDSDRPADAVTARAHTESARDAAAQPVVPAATGEAAARVPGAALVPGVASGRGVAPVPRAVRVSGAALVPGAASGPVLPSTAGAEPGGIEPVAPVLPASDQPTMPVHRPEPAPPIVVVPLPGAPGVAAPLARPLPLVASVAPVSADEPPRSSPVAVAQVTNMVSPAWAQPTQVPEDVAGHPAVVDRVVNTVHQRFLRHLAVEAERRAVR